MKVIVTIAALACLAVSAHGDTTITLLHFSDYHSHALPFTADEGERGGIARAIGYLRQQKRDGALVFSGGDTINRGAPAWSDKFECAEWPWWNGIVDAMAFGNHDADYGRAAFERCRNSVRYPILSANTDGFRPYAVFQRHGVRIGVFALAGPDFAQLTKGFMYRDRMSAARETVRILRERERAQVIVLIGHESAAADEELARAVPGIDVIFGTHSHLKRDLARIAGTATYTISPHQYLSYISRIDVTVRDDGDRNVTGRLVPVDASMPEDPRVARRVLRMQRELERDPRYRHLFQPIATLDAPVSTEALARRTVDVMREVTGADVAISTKSSFRRPLPAGTLTLELLRAALPYDNEIVVCSMSGEQLRLLGAAALDDSFATPFAWNTGAQVRVATTDYLANVAYRDVFVCDQQKTGLKVRDELRKRL